ncbi:MAG TPA: phosphoribosylamine--glycine ligase [Methanospirillum sp.]|nr:phosphoribosylamine--glycine ligase [Methanospirillum sp.]
MNNTHHANRDTIKVLVVGSGGREHAIALALSKSRNVSVYAALARLNPGIVSLATEVLVTSETDTTRIAQFCTEHSIGYAFIGPEVPLEAGIADSLAQAGVRCVGPVKAAARIETDKAFCRNLMKKYKIPGLPEYYIFHQADDALEFLAHAGHDYAIKPFGLTGGKGVRIMGEHVDRNGACEYVRELGGDVVIEERLIGEEFTLQAFVDGINLAPMPLVQDHKRAFEGDTGPNTGGMGSFTLPDHRMPFVDENDYNQALQIMIQVVRALADEGSPFVGVLYGQFMNTAHGPMVIEFNARFGDPEAMNVLSLLTSDLGDIVRAVTSGTLDSIPVTFAQKATVCKYLVPEGYPDEPVIGAEIRPGPTGEALLYYASVLAQDDHLITQSSRTMAFVGTGDTLETAEQIAEAASAAVTGPVRHRADIGTVTVLNKRITHMRELR